MWDYERVTNPCVGYQSLVWGCYKFVFQVMDASKQEEKIIYLQVKLGDEEPIRYKMKKETKMAKVMEAIARMNHKAVHSLKFTFGGSEIKDTDTPEILEMEENDVIDVLDTTDPDGIKQKVIYCEPIDWSKWQKEQESRVHPDLRAANLLAEAETADAGGGSEAQTLINPETIVMLTMTTTSRCGCCRDEGSVELGLFEDLVALAEARRRTANIMGLELRKNAKFTMKQYLSGVSGAEESVVCEMDDLYADSTCHGETILADGTGKVWCDDDPDGPSACGPMGLVEMRIKKLPKIKRRKIES